MIKLSCSMNMCNKGEVMDLEELRKRKSDLKEKSATCFAETDKIIDETARVQNVATETESILSDIDDEFEKITALNGVDITFMLFAALLQSLRWIVMPELKLSQLEKLSPEIAKEERLAANERLHVGGIYDGKSSGAEYELKELSKYRDKYPELAKQSQEGFYKKKNEFRSWIEILTQPVPYDAMNAMDKKSIPNIAGLNKQNLNGSYNNICGSNHHVATLGHDPMLGWVFGTANIMTNTVSFADFQSYRVNKGHKIKSLGEFAIANELQFMDQAIDYSNPCTIFDIFVESIKSAREDYKRIPAAVVRQAIHFASDKYCVNGLPIPILSAIDPQKAQELIEQGWNSVEFERLLKSDLEQISISAGLDLLINLVIEAIYLLCVDSKDSLDIRRVKINKILSTAGVISSSSNVLYVALTKNISKIDIGGIAVTMLELLHSQEFILKVKQEYIKNNFEQLVMGGEADE